MASDPYSDAVVEAARHDKLDKSLNRWWQHSVWDGWSVHYSTIVVRKDGRDTYIEADFLQDLVRAIRAADAKRREEKE